MSPLSLTCQASLIVSILIMIPPTTAIIRNQAVAPPTPAASLIMNGFSPRPTNPPGSNGIPRELLRRAAGIQFPPPDNWCGFIEGDYDNPLACTDTRYTCIFTGPVAVGCCRSLTGPCSALNTACMDNTANWAPYRSDTSRLICSIPSLPYCASMVFPQGRKYFFCATANEITNVQYMNDFYYTAIGSTVGPSSADPSITPTRRSLTTSTALTADSTSTASQNPTSVTNILQFTSTPTPAKKTIGTGAIAGIGAGAGILLLAAIAGIIFCVYKRKRKQNPVTPAQQPQANLNDNTPMQQQGSMASPYQNPSHPTMAPPYQNPLQPTMAPPYQNPSQPNTQYPNSAMPFSKDSKSPYESTRASSYGQPSPVASPLVVHGDPNNRASTISPPLSHNPSLVGNMRPHSPNPPMAGGADVQRVNSPDYYKHPTGSISEVDGSGLQPQIHEAASIPVYGGDGAQEYGQGQEYPPGALNTQSYAGQAQAVPSQVHEAPGQQEPKYVPYNPEIATPPPPQQEYPTSNHQPGQGAPLEQRRPVAPSAGPWEIGS